MKASRELLRIIDANLNRITEGLRVLEEFARLTLNDRELTQQLKDLRHHLAVADPEVKSQLLLARDASGDVGAAMDVAGEEEKRDVTNTVTANSKRVQESLRVMEELAKSPDITLDTESYRQTRFTMYTIEKNLLARMSRQDKLRRLPGLYVIIDTAFLHGRGHLDVARQAVRGGASVIQLRAKDCEIRDFIAMAEDLSDFCHQSGVLFIINDRLDVALAVGADGLHVGQDDMPFDAARRLLPADKILGGSARTVEEAELARASGVDYLGVGAMYATPTKGTPPPIGPEGLKKIRDKFDLPIVAIGGINKGNIGAVMRAGAVSAAVISAVMAADDVEAATRELVKIIEGEKGE